MASQFAIAICAYNSDERLLERLLKAVSKALSSFPDTDFILVDNNSDPPLTSLPFVDLFFKKHSSARYIVELRQGLTAARCSAIKSTTAPVVVFFDDDNEPHSNYLSVLNQYFSNYPNVGIWGPGTIMVEYVDPVNSWFEQNSEEFQERRKVFAYSCIPATWGPYSPNGTGFAVRREILQSYCAAVDSGILQTSDRKGVSLSSAGDVQIVWEGIKLGFAAGMIPELCCNHLITAQKANFHYLCRLRFGTTSSYRPALLESFPNDPSNLEESLNFFIISKHVLKGMLQIAIFPQKRYQIQLNLASDLGIFYGQARVLNYPNTTRIERLAKWLGLIT